MQFITMPKSIFFVAVSVFILAISPGEAFAVTDGNEQGEAVHRLSDEEMAEIRATGEEPPIDAEALLGGDPEERPQRRIQSEIAFGIGTHGYRELSASTLIPLGSEGFLALGFGHVEDNLPRRYHYGRGYDF